jgi:putative cell wall-binding protein
MSEDSKFINEIEIKQIEISELKIKLETERLEGIKLKQQVIQLKAKNFDLISNLKQYELKEAQERVENMKKGHTKFMEEIKEKYGVTSKRWGYSPVTGEIIQE